MKALLLAALYALLDRLQPTPDPVQVTEERLDVTVTTNRVTKEVRVITSMGHDTALDVHHDLNRGDEKPGSRNVVTAWEQTGYFPTQTKERH